MLKLELTKDEAYDLYAMLAVAFNRYQDRLSKATDPDLIIALKNLSQKTLALQTKVSEILPKP